MIIDSHQHVNWLEHDAAYLVADMDEQGIDVAWLLTWDQISERLRQETAVYRPVLNPLHARHDATHGGIPLVDAVKARDRYPDRFVLGYCPDPQRGSAADLFRAAVDMHGVRVCGEWKFFMCFDDPRCIELFRAAGELRAPVVLHLDGPDMPGDDGKIVHRHQWYGGDGVHFERAMGACPETNFVGHAPGVWRRLCGSNHQRPHPDWLDRFHNFYADLSAASALHALQRDAAFTRDLLLRYPDRFLFGRDMYGGDLSAFLDSLDLPDKVRRKIFCENAQRLTHRPEDAP